MDMTIKEKETTYNVRLIATQDDTPVRGNALASGDEEEDRRYEDMILERLDAGDVWAWAQVEVQASLPDGRTGSAHLGGCCYEDESDFKEGGYYEDLIAEAISRAESTPRYTKRIRINATTDLERVTHHVVLVEFIDDVTRFRVEECYCNPPEGLLIEDQTTPVGSPWK